MPLIALIDWLAFPPDAAAAFASWFGGGCSIRRWVAYTFLHGWATGWYPYPFIDPNTSGGRDVVAVLAAMTALLVVLVFLLVQYQRWRVAHARDRADLANR